MNELDKNEAVQRLKKAIVKANADYLKEYYNEIFPRTSITEAEAKSRRKVILNDLIEYIDHGLADEELVSLWHVAFPNFLTVEIDEEKDTLRFSEDAPYSFVD